MAYNNAWANHRLLTACAQLSQEDFARVRTSFFPSIQATLNHSLPVDWFYVDALERCFSRRAPHPDPATFFTPTEPFATCAPLADAQRAVDRRLVTLSAGLTDGDLEQTVAITRRSGIARDEAPRLFAHLFQHQIHHRGQVHAMLAGTTVAPPQLDEFFCANEAHLRVAELAELGYSETLVFGGHQP
jgi:uncharacterized damage-inducible protein DinB